MPVIHRFAQTASNGPLPPSPADGFLLYSREVLMTWIKGSRFVLLALFLGCSPGVGQFDNCTGIPGYISDGWCDSSNNNPSCNYDGGDCCDCTCVDGLQYECGYNGYYCLDSSCTDSSSSYPECMEDLLLPGNGFCDEVTNNLECG